MMNKLIKLVLSFLSILTLALAIALISAQGTTTVSLADFEANPASTIKAPLMIYNVTDVVGGEFNTSFAPSVVHVTDISEGDIGTTMSNINNEAGWAYMNVFGAEGKSGDVVFAYLTFKAVGSEGEKSSLNIAVISLFNTNYMDISYKTENGTFAIRDITPPTSISNLRNATGNFWINWTWTNPSDNDFNHTMVYLDGTWQTNTSNSYYNATGLNPDTTYEIGTHTVDTSGNVNNTLVNQRAKTLALNSAPVADPNGPYTGMEGVAILFNGSGSYDTDGSIVAYEWTFGDGNTSSEVNPTHVYAQNGIYTVTLTVTDNDGATNTNTTTVMVADTWPIADFTATPTSGPEPLIVTFTDKSTSYDGITAWEWDFDSDGVIDNTTQNPIFTYTEGGTYTVTLKVYEADGGSGTETKEDYITVTKVNNAPYKPHNPSPSDGAINISVNTDLSWSGGDPDADDTVTYDVYFGTNTTPPLPLASENQTETTYDPGTLNYSTRYYWWIVATDNHGASNESEIWNFTTTAASDSPPLVTNPAATPATILNDPGRPRAPGTNISQLNVTVTDDTEVDTVIIDLSLIGGSAEAQMTKIPGTDIWTVTVKATAGINLTHNLVVNATDISGNFNNTVSITLTVLRRSDVSRDNIVDMNDAVYITRYLAGLEPERSNPPPVLVGDIVGSGGDPTGDGIVDMKDAVYIARYKAGWEDEP